MHSIPQVERTSKKTSNDTRTLFERGYNVRLVRGTFGVFQVRNTEGNVYTVNAFEGCSCPGSIIRHSCKHMTQLPALVEAQAAYWGSRDRDKQNGQRNSDLAWNLRAVADRLWGAGLMAIDAAYCSDERKAA